MSTLPELVDCENVGDEIRVMEHAGECSFCDSVAQAIWHGAAPDCIRVCRTCAERVLPALIADAMVGSYSRGEMTANLTQPILNAVERTQKAFWRALAIALARRGGELELLRRFRDQELAKRNGTPS